MNCFKCKKPIFSEHLTMRFDSVNMGHAVCDVEAAERAVKTPIGALTSGNAPKLSADDFRPKSDKAVWLQTYLGKQLRVPEWNHDAICLEETAYVLSGIHRFGARTAPYYTVAEHSVRVAYCVEALGGSVLEQFQAINHEGDEALLGFDPASPLLRLLPDLKALKLLAHESYMRRYDLPVDLPAVVKHADLILLATERRDLMRGGEFVNMPLAPPATPLKTKITPWPNPYARFVQRWRELAAAAGFKGRE